MLKLHRPCPACPFRIDTPGYLRPGRMAAIIAELLADDWMVFPCHETTAPEEDPETGQVSMEITESSQACAGALILLHKLGRPPVQLRIAAALGHWSIEQLDLTAHVGDTPEQLEQHHASIWSRP